MHGFLGGGGNRRRAGLSLPVRAGFLAAHSAVTAPRRCPPQSLFELDNCPIACIPLTFLWCCVILLSKSRPAGRLTRYLLSAGEYTKQTGMRKNTQNARHATTRDTSDEQRRQSGQHTKGKQRELCLSLSSISHTGPSRSFLSRPSLARRQTSRTVDSTTFSARSAPAILQTMPRAVPRLPRRPAPSRSSRAAPLIRAA